MITSYKDGAVFTVCIKKVIDEQKAMAKIDPDIPVILITAHGDISMAVEAIQSGAYDFLEKPFEPERLLDSAQWAIEKRTLVMENRELLTSLNVAGGLDARLVGTNLRMRALKEQIMGLAPTPAKAMENQTLRQDLYYRLNTMELIIPLMKKATIKCSPYPILIFTMKSPEIIIIIERTRYMLSDSPNRTTLKKTPESGIKKTNECKAVAPNFWSRLFQAINPKAAAITDWYRSAVIIVGFKVFTI